MAAPIKECICHLADFDVGALIPCTDVTWTKLYSCSNVWATVDGIEKEIALSILSYSSEVVPDIGFYRQCYQKFTNSKRIECGAKRRDAGRLRSSEDQQGECEASDSEPASKVPTLRSSFTTSKSERRSKHVLPKECIICRKSKKTQDKVTGKRKIEALVICETDAKKLIEAAQLKDDSRILLQIGNFDPVCIEVRYHASCYKLYTKCVYNDNPKETYGVRPLTLSFDTFCEEVIEKRLIACGDVMKINCLTKLFVDTVMKVEGIDISGYRNFQLKDRLLKRYPALEFVQPEPRSCELVLYRSEDAVNTSSFINMSRDTDSTDFDSESEEYEISQSISNSTQDDFATLFRAAIIVKRAIHECQGVTMWPPSAEDLTRDKCLGVVPPMMYNFLAWACGLSDTFSVDRVESINNDAQQKLLSLSQDIIFMATQGKNGI